MKEFGLGDSKIIIVNDDGARVQAETLPRSEQAKVTEGLAKYANIDPADVSINDVGPTWGKQVSEKALRALVVFFFFIAIYLSLRFEWKMAASAIIAVIHDILVTVGVYAITGFEVTPATVIAFLTILGFSLYDTVVVFDKVKENEAAPRHRQGHDLLRDGQPLAEPGAGPVVEHLVRGVAPGDLAARRRLVASWAR